MRGIGSRMVVLAFAAAAVAFAGCGFVQLPASSVIDGWPIGEPLECRPGDECEEYVPVATKGLDRRDPGHAPVIDVRLFNQGPYRHDDGTTVLSVCSGGCPSVAVFQLADGSVRAIGVGTPGISTEPQPSDWGPLLNWEAPKATPAPNAITYAAR